MNTPSESVTNPVANFFNEQEIAEAADFHSKRMHQEQEMQNKCECESANWPDGNYEYEQMIAEGAEFDTKKMIEVAAFFIAEKRGFAPGMQLADWLQAESSVEAWLRSVQHV